jgi:hypothetical protein
MRLFELAAVRVPCPDRPHHDKFVPCTRISSRPRETLECEGVRPSRSSLAGAGPWIGALIVVPAVATAVR